jgi:hypothetical protein
MVRIVRPSEGGQSSEWQKGRKKSMRIARFRDRFCQELAGIADSCSRLFGTIKPTTQSFASQRICPAAIAKADQPHRRVLVICCQLNGIQ